MVAMNWLLSTSAFALQNDSPSLLLGFEFQLLWHAETDFTVCSPEVVSVALSSGWSDSVPAWWLCCTRAGSVCPHASSPQGCLLPLPHQPFPSVSKTVPKGVPSTQGSPDVSGHSGDLLTPLLLP